MDHGRRTLDFFICFLFLDDFLLLYNRYCWWGFAKIQIQYSPSQVYIFLIQHALTTETYIFLVGPWLLLKWVVTLGTTGAMLDGSKALRQERSRRGRRGGDPVKYGLCWCPCGRFFEIRDHVTGWGLWLFSPITGELWEGGLSLATTRPTHRGSHHI